MENANSKVKVPIGTILMYGGSVNENSRKDLFEQGWLICDGEDFITTDFPDLFATIQHAFGGSGNRFYLPDCRGMFIRGVDCTEGRSKDECRGLDPEALSREASIEGGNTGSKVGSIQEDQYKKHSHGVATLADRTQVKKKNLETILLAKHKENLHDSLDAGGKETRPVNLYLNFIIRFK